MKTNKPKTPLRYYLSGKRNAMLPSSRQQTTYRIRRNDVAEKNGRKFKFLLGHGHLVKNDLFSLCPPIGIALNYNYDFIHSWTSSYVLFKLCVMLKMNPVKLNKEKTTWKSARDTSEIRDSSSWLLLFLAFSLIELQGRNQLLYKLCDLLSKPVFYQSESE